ncbi:hypothetical protein DFH06DRAFT_1146157 [Mycena polygramma]|nr:hypothetical protein DFH06DRAFT_1146157 [Mycena polygramma]
MANAALAMNAQDDSGNAAEKLILDPQQDPPDITLYMYLPERSWTKTICIPRDKLGLLCRNPVKWLRFFGSNLYGADGEIYSKAHDDPEEDKTIFDDEDDMSDEEDEEDEAEAADVNEDETMADVEEEEKVPAAEGSHNESREGPASKKPPVDQATILSYTACLEKIPAVCYFWSKYAPRVLDLQMISDRKSTKQSTSSTGSKRDTRIPTIVKKRDQTCVFHASTSHTASLDLVEACHIVPFSKGDEYVQHLEHYHEVPEEDQMGTVETPLNIISMKDSWHTYVSRSRAVIMLVPNRFLSVEDINFIPKPRFERGDFSDAILQDLEEGSQDGSQSRSPTPPHTGRHSDDDFTPTTPVSDQPGTLRAPSTRVHGKAEQASAQATKKKKDEEAALEAAQRALAHLTSAQGYPKFPKPAEEPFNDESQLVMQYIVTGESGGVGVSMTDAQIIPHNTPAYLRQGTRLSVCALHAAYTCGIWNAYRHQINEPNLIPEIPRFDHYGLPRSKSSSEESSSSGTTSSSAAPASSSTSFSTSRSLPSPLTGKQQQRGEWDGNESARTGWDHILGWSIPSVAASQKLEIRRARATERKAKRMNIGQWNSTVVGHT